MISEQEAVDSVLALGTAMLSDDKQAREAGYAGMDEESLKRVIRWAMRLLLQNHNIVANISQVDGLELWQKLCTLNSLAKTIEPDSN